MYTIEELISDWKDLRVAQRKRKALFMRVLLTLHRGPVRDKRSAIRVMYEMLQSADPDNSRDSVRSVVEDLEKIKVISLDKTVRTTREISLNKKLDPRLVVYMEDQTGLQIEPVPEVSQEEPEPASQIDASEEHHRERDEGAVMLLNLLGSEGLARLAPLVINAAVAWVIESGIDGVLESLEVAIADFRQARLNEIEDLQRKLEEAEGRVEAVRAELASAMKPPPAPLPEVDKFAEVINTIDPEPPPRKYIKVKFWGALTPRQFDVFKAALLDDDGLSFNRSLLRDRLRGVVTEDEVDQHVREGTEPMLVLLSNAVERGILDDHEKRMLDMLVTRWGNRPFKNVCQWMASNLNQTKSDVDFLQYAEGRLAQLGPKMPRKLRQIAQDAMRVQRRRHGRDAESGRQLDRNTGHKHPIRRA